jgi:hypothetical protein
MLPEPLRTPAASIALCTLLATAGLATHVTRALPAAVWSVAAWSLLVGFGVGTVAALVAGWTVLAVLLGLAAVVGGALAGVAKLRDRLLDLFREFALAWATAQSTLLVDLLVATEHLADRAEQMNRAPSAGVLLVVGAVVPAALLSGSSER